MKGKTLEDILKEGEEIYEISEESDKKCDEISLVDNWAEVIYNIKKPKIKERFMKLGSKSESKLFFEALDYEYGINGKKKDLSKALSYYKESEVNNNDTISMYRLYHIYKKDYVKFGFPKRNRVLEKFYLFKCFAFLEGEELDHSRNLFNRFDVIREIATQLSVEDIELIKFRLFISYLKENYKELKISLQDIIIIEAVLLLKFTVDIENEKDVTLLFPEGVINTNNEAMYKVAFFLSGAKLPIAEKYFKVLFDKKYYRSYPDYALFLYNVKKDIPKSLEISKIGYNNGVISAGNIYYDIYLDTCDFYKFMTDKSSPNLLKEIFDLLIDLISYDEMYRFFEFFFLRKIGIKHFGQQEFFDNYYFEYTKEIVAYIQDITKGENGNKDEIKKYYQRDDFYCEFNLVMGEILCYGVEEILQKNYEKSIEKFKIAYKKSDSITYKRFAYAYICFIRQKLLNSGSKEITLDKIKKNKKKLFDYYLTSIKKMEEYSHLSSSYSYFMAKMYSKKYGGEGDNDLLMEYIFLKKACNRSLDNPGYGSIVAVYRKYKSKKKLEKEENTKFKSVFDEIHYKSDNEGYGEDNSICPICLDKKRDIICIPCSHLYCESCIIKILESNKCPICRRIILFSIKVKK